MKLKEVKEILALKRIRTQTSNHFQLYILTNLGYGLTLFYAKTTLIHLKTFVVDLLK